MHILTFRSTPILPAVVSRSDTHAGGQNTDTAAMYVQEACKFMEARANATANSVSDQRTRHATRHMHVPHAILARVPQEDNGGRAGDRADRLELSEPCSDTIPDFEKRLTQQRASSRPSGA